MEYSTEEDSENPKKFVVKVLLFAFTQVDKEPSHDELAAWVKRYEEAASKQLIGHILIVDVVAEGLRPK